MSRLKGLLFAVISSSTFGLIPLFAIPAIQEGVGLDSVLFYRFALSTLFVGAILLFKQTDMRIYLKDYLSLFSLGALYASTALFMTEAYFYIPSGVATTIHFLYPVLVTLLMIFFFKDKASLPILIATVMAIGGVYLLSSGEGSSALNIKGILLALITVATYAMYMVGVNKSRVRNMDGLKMTFYVLFSAAFIFLINVLAKGNGIDAIPNSSAAINIFLLALIPTLVSDFTLILAVQQIGSTTTAILGCMEPLTAVSMGVLFLNESFGAAQIIGIIIVLTAVSVVVITNNPSSFLMKKILFPAFFLQRGKRS